MAFRYPITFTPSCGKLGNSLERAPVAIIIESALYSVTVPFSDVTSTFLPVFIFPKPSIISILFFFH